MKKVVSWTFGSVFRTFGRIIAYLIFGAILGLILSKTGVKLPDILGISVVNATTTDRWALNLPNITDGRWFDCTSSTNCNTQLDTVNINTNNRYYIAGDTSATLATNGILLGSFSPYTLQKGYVYAVAFYVCSNKNLSNTTHDMYSSTYANRAVNSTLYNSTGRGSLTNVPFVAGSNVGDYCYVYQGSIVPDTDSAWVFLRLKSSSSITGFVPAMISMTVEGIGPYSTIISNAVSSAISNKGLATSQDLQATQDAITQNQNENTQQQIESQKVCKTTKYDKNGFSNFGYITLTGNIVSNNNWKYSDFIEVEELYILTSTTGQNAGACFYDDTKTLISCKSLTQLTSGNVTLPTGTKYFRGSIYILENKPVYEVKNCQNGNQALSDSLNDDNVGDAESSASSWFSNFTTNTHGLTSIITAPLSAIQSLTSSFCSPLVLPLPFVNEDLTLPCMRSIYVDNFGDFMNLYDVIVTGIISYWVMVRIFALVKDFKNPDHDEIEVVDL